MTPICTVVGPSMSRDDHNYVVRVMTIDSDGVTIRVADRNTNAATSKRVRKSLLGAKAVNADFSGWIGLVDWAAAYCGQSVPTDNWHAFYEPEREVRWTRR